MTNTKKPFFVFLSTVMLIASVARAEDLNVDNLPCFSNVIIFGDSLSDIGNGPESLTLNGDDTTSGFFTNAYVPISNPVNPNEDWILPGLDLEFPSEIEILGLYAATLPQQLLLCEDGESFKDCNEKNNKRAYRSLNWVEYFVSNAALLNLIGKDEQGVDLRPWVIQYKEQNVDGIQSVDYAFYSALSGDECGDFGLNVVPCHFPLEGSVFETQAIYRNTQTTNASGNQEARNQVIIPGLGKQIEMFRRDKEEERVKVDNDTLYLVYVGANDISNAFFDWVDGEISFGQFLAHLTVTIPREIASKRYRRSGINRLIRLGAKNIRVLGQYNIGLSPLIFTDAGENLTLAQKHALAAALNVLITLYNNSLQRFVSEFRNQGEVDVQYVDIQGPIKKVANQLLSKQPGNPPLVRQGYFYSIGDRCITAVQTLIEAGQAASCFSEDPYITTAPIGFWNDVHLSTQFNQVIASAVLDQLTGGTENVKSLGEAEGVLRDYFRSGKGHSGHHRSRR